MQTDASTIRVQQFNHLVDKNDPFMKNEEFDRVKRNIASFFKRKPEN